MSEKIRWGIMSTGNIAHAFATALSRLDDAEIVAVGSRKQETAEEFAEKYNIPNRHGSYEALVNDPEVDVIYIGTPHIFHHDNMRLCLEAGKHVICEKPFTINQQEAQDIFELARQKNLFVVEALWTRFSPALLKIQSLIAEGAIGKIQVVTADFGFRAKYNPKGRLFNPDLAGGALLDLGIYPLMLAVTLLGEPHIIHSAAHMGETGVDEQFGLLLQYSDGEIASLTATLLANTALEASICGTEGRINIPPNWWAPEEFTLKQHDRDEQVFDMPFDYNGYEYEAREVMRCLREGLTESPMMSHEDTMIIQRTMDHIRTGWGLVYPSET